MNTNNLFVSTVAALVALAIGGIGPALIAFGSAFTICLLLDLGNELDKGPP